MVEMTSGKTVVYDGFGDIRFYGMQLGTIFSASVSGGLLMMKAGIG